MHANVHAMNEDALRRGEGRGGSAFGGDKRRIYMAGRTRTESGYEGRPLASWEPRESCTTGVFTAGTVPDAHVTLVEQKQ